MGGHATLMIAHRQASLIDLHALLVILNSSVASCWVDELSVERNTERRTVAELPIPVSKDLKPLSELGKKLENLAQKGSRDFLSVLEQVDGLVFDAYSLPPSIKSAVVQRFIDRPDASGVVRYTGDQATWPASDASQVSSGRERGLRYVGFVADVAGNRIKVVLSGAGGLEAQWIEVPRKMPGWLCRPDATFEVVGNLEDPDGLDWSFQELAWQSSEMWDSLL
jgi:hypothetical protein